VVRGLKCTGTLLLTLAACGPGDPGLEPEAESRAESPIARGEQLYRSHGCTACHGPAGAGDGLLADQLDPKPRDLGDAASYRQGHSADRVARTIGMGMPGPGISPMPSYPHLSRADSEALAGYVVSLQRAGGALSVSHGWVRAVPEVAPASAAYLEIRNDADRARALVGGRTDRARVVEIHEVRSEGGSMSMSPIEELVIAPRSAARLAPGGPHLMLIGLRQPLREGETLELELRFADGEELPVRLPVLRDAPEEGT
jgi:copper(I)-binding protein